MTNRKRIRLIERYLGGGMASADLQNFHQHLENDPSLRELLQEEQSIESALQRDCNAIPVMGIESLERMLKERRTPGSGTKPPSLHRDSSGKGGGWPWLDTPFVERALHWLSRREAIAIVSAIGIVLSIWAVFAWKTPSAARPIKESTTSPAAPPTVPMPISDSSLQSMPGQQGGEGVSDAPNDVMGTAAPDSAARVLRREDSVLSRSLPAGSAVSPSVIHSSAGAPIGVEADSVKAPSRDTTIDPSQQVVIRRPPKRPPADSVELMRIYEEAVEQTRRYRAEERARRNREFEIMDSLRMSSDPDN